MHKHLYSLAICVLLAGISQAQDTKPAPIWKPLFNGDNLSGWQSVNVAADTFTVRDGIIVSTGKPTGVMRTECMYENFIAELEWRHMQRGGNAGFFVWGDGIPSIGTPFTRGIEVQILDNGYDRPGKNDFYTSHGDIFPIHGAKMTPSGRIASTGIRSFPTHELSHSSPEWNHYRVVANNGEVRLSVNGQEVTVGQNCWPRKGYICLEAEGSECHFRNLRIQELPSTGADASATARSGDGYIPLFNGLNLDGWKIPAGDNGHWRVINEVIDYDALSEAPGEKSLESEHEYTNFNLIVDWRIKETPFVNHHVAQILPDGSEAVDAQGKPIKLSVPDSDSGIFLRGSDKHQVNIWCWPIGSGEMYGIRRDKTMSAQVRASVTPRVKADNKIGQWNRFEITVRGNVVTVVLNGQTVIEGASIPDLPPKGAVVLQHHGSKKDGQWTGPPSLLQFRNIMIKELP